MLSSCARALYFAVAAKSVNILKFMLFMSIAIVLPPAGLDVLSLLFTHYAVKGYTKSATRQGFVTYVTFTAKTQTQLDATFAALPSAMPFSIYPARGRGFLV